MVDRGTVRLGSAFRALTRPISPVELSTAGAIEAVSSAFVFMAVAGLVIAAVKGKTLRDKTLPFKLAHWEDTTLRLLPTNRGHNFLYDEIQANFSFNKTTDEWIWRVVGVLYSTTLHSLARRKRRRNSNPALPYQGKPHQRRRKAYSGYRESLLDRTVVSRFG
jgi:hypothetical protein